mmetsp:Transcript_46087/g.100163  ORF Transcript_46087/g.100163 Transcript_46087/m.100163 type:complete len:103 (+) Transcript_46087:478-786(+)
MVACRSMRGTYRSLLLGLDVKIDWPVRWSKSLQGTKRNAVEVSPLVAAVLTAASAAVAAAVAAVAAVVAVAVAVAEAVAVALQPSLSPTTATGSAVNESSIV